MLVLGRPEASASTTGEGEAELTDLVLRLREYGKPDHIPTPAGQLEAAAFVGSRVEYADIAPCEGDDGIDLGGETGESLSGR